MASFFCDAKGVLLVDYPEKVHTITRAFYADPLTQLWEKIKKVWRVKLTRGLFFHQENTLAHKST